MAATMDGDEIMQRLAQDQALNPQIKELTIADDEVEALAEHLCWYTDLSAAETARHIREGVVKIGAKRLVVKPHEPSPR